MDRSTVLDYPDLPAERYWQKRAFGEWTFRPGPMLMFLKGMNSWEEIKSGFEIARQHLSWVGTASGGGVE